MRKQYVFRPDGWNSLEVRVFPSAVVLAPAAEIVRIDAHVQQARVHPHHEVHQKVRHHAHQTVHHVTHLGGVTSGGGSYGGGSY